MLTDEMLEDLLRGAGDAVPVPEEGLARVRARLAQLERTAEPAVVGTRSHAKLALLRRLEPAQWVGVAAGVLLLAAVAGGITLAANSHSSGGKASSANGALAPQPASVP